MVFTFNLISQKVIYTDNSSTSSNCFICTNTSVGHKKAVRSPVQWPPHITSIPGIPGIYGLAQHCLSLHCTSLNSTCSTELNCTTVLNTDAYYLLHFITRQLLTQGSVREQCQGDWKSDIPGYWQQHGMMWHNTKY